MKKYYIGLIVIAVITLGLLIYTITLGTSSKQDVITEKKANEIAQKLNSYISTNQSIPDSLAAANISDAPSTITYTKNSDGTTYKFCATYKAASDYGGTDFTGLLWGSALQGASQSSDSVNYNDVSSSSYQPATLYPNYYHTKGENCQTIKPYIYQSCSGLGSVPVYNTYGTSTCQNILNSSPSSYTSPAGGSTVANTAKDTERKTDLKALASHLEVYNAQNGYYPSLVELSNSSWVAANLKGLDKEALRDPSGVSYVILSSPKANYYSYSVKPSSCDNTTGNECTSFVLTATLSVGTNYTVNSLSQ